LPTGLLISRPRLDITQLGAPPRFSGARLVPRIFGTHVFKLLPAREYLRKRFATDERSPRSCVAITITVLCPPHSIQARFTGLVSGPRTSDVREGDPCASQSWARRSHARFAAAIPRRTKVASLRVHISLMLPKQVSETQMAEGHLRGPVEFRLR
jgi:hypothetical protein